MEHVIEADLRNEYDPFVLGETLLRHQKIREGECRCGEYPLGTSFAAHIVAMYEETPWFLRQRAINDTIRDGFPDGPQD